MELNDKIRSVKGVGEKTEKLLHKMEIYTIEDLLHYYPRDYVFYEDITPISSLQEGMTFVISGTIVGKVQMVKKKNLTITMITVRDETGSIKASWFHMPYLKKTFEKGGNIVLRGKAVFQYGAWCMEQPEIFYPASSYDNMRQTLKPIYPLIAGMTNTMMTKMIGEVLHASVIPQKNIMDKMSNLEGFQTLDFALREIHFPGSKSSYREARERLVFEEFLLFLLALRMLREEQKGKENVWKIYNSDIMDSYIERLPFTLTKAQQKVWKEIKQDLTGKTAMTRMVQGDVGSGKTILALLALLLVVENGYQGAMMAPTEVLARQHFESVRSLLSILGVETDVVLLTGTMTAKEKRSAYENIASGQAKIVIGTHALIQNKVLYHSLALVITDEQHRFGVKQRELFERKGNAPHVLVMSATPIPRSLAILLYGDLNLSVVDELPANRLPIKNCVVDQSYRKTAYHFMEKQILEGRQCYVICPMVEESESVDGENVMDYAKRLQHEMGNDVRIGILHGKMKPDEKDRIMGEFQRREMDVLVSTTVIEVGINVPNATVMMIENAERFGLAQLHQLRGRVGRGEHQSYCIFMSGSKTNDAKERLSILSQSNDGFFIANEDLKLRGPGDLFGLRQSGMLGFKIADIIQDAEILQKAGQATDLFLNQNLPFDETERKEMICCVKRYIHHELNGPVL